MRGVWQGVGGAHSKPVGGKMGGVKPPENLYEFLGENGSNPLFWAKNK